MKKYIVTIPIAGHLSFEVKAKNEQSAIAKAWLMDACHGELRWETLSSFRTGIVCHCPLPWEVEAEEI